MTRLRHEKLTYELRGLIFDVRSELKTGWSEEVYHRALLQFSQDRSIPVRSKQRKAIFHRGVKVKVFECDLIAWDIIILELKVLPFTTFAPEHLAQLIHYLKCWNKDLGLLVNFGPTRAQIKRLVWDEPELKLEEDYSAIKALLTDTDRSYLRQIRQSILNIGQQYGLGYPDTMYRKIVAVEMNHNGLTFEANVNILARWNGKVLAHHSSDHLLVENNYLLNVRSLLDRPTRYDFARTKTYLQNLGLKVGLIINFGKKQLQIHGVKAD